MTTPLELPELIERLRNAAKHVEETTDAYNDTHCTFLPFTPWSMKTMLDEAADALAESEARAAALATRLAEVEAEAEDAARWRELTGCWAGMQQRGSQMEIGISTPRWRVPGDVESFNEAFDRKYELDGR